MVHEEKKGIFFIHGASEILTRRDNLKAAIKDNMRNSKHFCLFPQRKTVYIEGKKLVYRALIIDSLETRTDDVKDKITEAFHSKDIRLIGLRIVLVTPTMDMNIATIALSASNHNGQMINTTHHTIRGFQNARY